MDSILSQLRSISPSTQRIESLINRIECGELSDLSLINTRFSLVQELVDVGRSDLARVLLSDTNSPDSTPTAPRSPLPLSNVIVEFE